MLSTKFKDHRSAGVGDFNHILAWRLSWLHDQDHLNKLSFPITLRLHMKIKQCFQRKTMSPNHILSLELILEIRWGTPKHCSNLFVCLNEHWCQGHQNLITKSYHLLSPDPIMWLVKTHTLIQYRNRLQTRLLIAWWPWNLVKVTKILSLLPPIPIMYLWQICQNPCIGSLDILQIKLIFIVLIMWWPWKLGQSHQILIKLFIYSFIYLSQWYNTWSFVWINHLVQEFGCRQAFVESKEGRALRTLKFC